MSWLLIPLVLAVVIFCGVQVVSGRWRPAGPPPPDPQAAARWEKARRHGFWYYALPFIPRWGCIFSGSMILPLLWQQTEISRERIAVFSLLSLLFGGIAAAVSWISLREDVSRLARSTDGK